MVLYAFLSVVTGDRYSQVHYGLLIRNITKADNGIYTCCAEVQSTGALSQRDIEVIVYCKFVFIPDRVSVSTLSIRPFIWTDVVTTISHERPKQSM